MIPPPLRCRVTGIQVCFGLLRFNPFVHFFVLSFVYIFEPSFARIFVLLFFFVAFP